MLRTVLLKLQDAGLKLNVKRCHFFVDHVDYLGFLFDKAGIHPSSSKIDAIVHAPIPCDVKQLQCFIDMCNFYNRFIHNFASLMAPFYSLLKKMFHFSGLNYSKKRSTKSNNILLMVIFCKILCHIMKLVWKRFFFLWFGRCFNAKIIAFRTLVACTICLTLA